MLFAGSERGEKHLCDAGFEVFRGFAAHAAYEDMSVDEGAEEEGYADFVVEGFPDEALALATLNHSDEALSGRVTDPRTPGVSEGGVAGAVGHEMRPHLFLEGLVDAGLVGEERDEVVAVVACVEGGRHLVEAVDMDHDLHGEGVLVGPVLVNSGFADAGG